MELNPGESHAWAALTALTPTYGHWAIREQAVERGVARADVNGPPPLRLRGEFRRDVGKTGAALADVRRLVALHPVVPFIRANLVDALVAAGLIAEARAASAKAVDTWPRDVPLWRQRFWLLAFSGDHDGARALLADGVAPRPVRPADRAHMALALTALETRAPADVAAALDALAAAARDGQGYAEQAIQLAAALDAPDRAFALADRLYAPDAPAERFRYRDFVEYVRAGERPTALWFTPPASRLWSDPRFLQLMRRIGMADYWRRRGGPDLCRTPALRSRCAEAGLVT